MAKKEPDAEIVDSALEKLSRDLPESEDALEGELLDKGQTDTGDDIPDDLVFTTKTKAKDEPKDDDDFLEIKLDGQLLLAMRPAKGAWTILLAAMSRASTQADRTQAIMNFVYSSFDQPSQMLIQNRLMSPGDDFDIDLIGDMVGMLIKKWAPAYSRKERRAAARANAR